MPPQALEALLFAAGEPLEKKELAKLLGINDSQLRTATLALSRELAGRGLTLVETERELELRTNAAAAEFVKKLRESELSRDLGKASLETLAVVAYHQGATRSEIDWVRGVNSSASMRTLMLRGLVEGREDERDRRRTRYTLTAEALGHLGIANATDLPRFAELSAQTADAITHDEAVETAATE